jgi:hypothetical protein
MEADLKGYSQIHHIHRSKIKNLMLSSNAKKKKKEQRQSPHFSLTINNNNIVVTQLEIDTTTSRSYGQHSTTAPSCSLYCVGNLIHLMKLSYDLIQPHTKPIIGILVRSLESNSPQGHSCHTLYLTQQMLLMAASLSCATQAIIGMDCLLKMINQHLPLYNLTIIADNPLAG